MEYEENDDVQRADVFLGPRCSAQSNPGMKARLR